MKVGELAENSVVNNSELKFKLSHSRSIANLLELMKDYKVVILEGIHKSGKTHMVNYFNKHSDRKIIKYSTGSHMKGRRDSIINNRGAVTHLDSFFPLFSGFFYAVDTMLQFIPYIEEDNHDALYLLDRSHVSNSYYNHAQFYEAKYAEYLHKFREQGLDVLTVIIQPDTVPPGLFDEFLQDRRVPSIKQYLIDAGIYKDKVLSMAYSDTVIYNHTYGTSI